MPRTSATPGKTNKLILNLIPVALIAAGAFYGFGKPVPTATAADAGIVCSLALAAPNPKRWHTACKETVAPGTYQVGYRGTLYADRINAKMDDPGRIYLSATLSKVTGKPKWGDLTVKQATPGKVFQFEAEVAASKTVTLEKTTTFYLLVNAHDNDYDNDIEHLRFEGAITVERLS